MPTTAARGTWSSLRPSLRTWWGRYVVVSCTAIVVLVGAVVAAGGLRSAEAVPLPEWQAGEQHDLGEVEATVLDHMVTDDVRADYLEYVDGPAVAWLVVRVEVAAHEETVEFVPEVVAPPEGVVMGDEPETVVALQDGTTGPAIHPGLPQQVAYFWPLRDPRDVPDPLRMDVLVRPWAFSPTSNRYTWGQEEPAARITIPRNDTMPGLFEEEW
ncbi:hypothetical protein [Georgenia alba]|uniref:Uncharacterized protein n=1 Tax=Georgenia alba TaxID=2233858 RepID=A0ABW2Q4B3_9MICO